MVAIAAAALVAFIGGLYFITHHKKKSRKLCRAIKSPATACRPSLKSAGAISKSWKAASRVLKPTEPSAGGEIMNQDQLTDEQRQLLDQMQADMRRQPTQLSEVPWNEQTPAQRQQTLQRQKQLQQQQQMQQWNNTAQQPVRTAPRVETPRTEAPRTETRYQQPQTRTVQTQQPARATTQPAQPPRQQQTTNAPYQDLLQTPPHTTQRETAQSKPAQTAPVTRETEAAKPAEKKDERRWMVQCGSFKGTEQAETVRAQLAFEGFDSRITSNNGWNRVVIGPIKGKDNADGTLNRLKMAGHSNCIRLASGVETPKHPHL